MTTISLAGHSCLRLERDGRVLVVDPGNFSDPAAVQGAAAVLVTHEHADHVQPAQLAAALAADPSLQVWAPPPVVAQLEAAGATTRVHAVAEGDRLEIAGFDVQVLGRRHATVHPSIPPVANVGYLIDGALLHPGDSWTVPPAGTGVQVLFLPVGGPWLKLSESVDYLLAVAPVTAVPIHDATLNDAGRALADGIVGALGGSAEYRRLAPGQTLTV